MRSVAGGGLHEAGVVFVDGVVGEVHVHLVEVVLGGGLVLLGGEAGQAFFVDKDPQRVAAGD